ncbi:MAG: deoxyribonuclease IV [Kiritimatiellae bacterium]|nr:deoxyribonuclease IV [Kiritimatiellia bacterium]
MKIGAHISSSGGYLAMARTAVSIGANVFQFFTRNPRGGDAKALDLDDVAAFNVFAAREGIGPILAHAPYTLNAAAARPEIREFAENTMRDDLERLEHTPGAMYNFHPGSHVGQGAEAGIELISAMLGRIWRKPYGTTVLLETMAGKGSEIGRDFAEIRAVIDRTLALAPDAKLGVCLDTCHVWDGGYDIVNRLDETLEEFDRTVGLGRLKAIHLNDSMNPLGAHKDRHQKIGQGHIGVEAFRRIVNHPALKDLPFYLETPNDIAGYADEIKLLKGLVPC